MAHPIRQRMLSELRDHPGLRLHQLGSIVGQESASLKWHLQVLERAGLVTSHSAGQTRYYTLRGISPEDLALAHVLARLRSSRRAQALGVLARVEELTVPQASFHLECSAAAARTALDELAKAGLAVRQRRGVTKVYSATGLGQRAAAALSP